MEHGYQFAWHKNGKILIKKRNGERAIAVENEEAWVTSLGDRLNFIK